MSCFSGWCFLAKACWGERSVDERHWFALGDTHWQGVNMDGATHCIYNCIVSSPATSSVFDTRSFHVWVCSHQGEALVAVLVNILTKLHLILCFKLTSVRVFRNPLWRFLLAKQYNACDWFPALVFFVKPETQFKFKRVFGHTTRVNVLFANHHKENAYISHLHVDGTQLQAINALLFMKHCTGNV